MPHFYLNKFTLLLTVFIIGGINGMAHAEVTYLNPPEIAPPNGYTHVVEVKGNHRTLYIAGQLGLDKENKLAEGFEAQARQTFKNLESALESMGARFDQVVKLNMYLTDFANQGQIMRKVRDEYVNTAAPPASTAVEISRLALPDALIEIEAIAIVPKD